MPGMQERAQLFRPEVLRQQQRRDFGTPLLQPRIRSQLVIAFTIGLLLSVTALLMTIDYQETQPARGILRAAEGRHQVIAPVAATVTRIAVMPGQAVSKGQVLAALARTRYSVTGDSVPREDIHRLEVQLQLLHQEQELHKQRFVRRREQTQMALASLQQSEALLETELRLLRAQSSLNSASLEKITTLVAARALPGASLEQARVERLGFQLREQEALQRQHGNTMQREMRLAELDSLQLDFQQALLRLEQEQQQLELALSQRMHDAQFSVVAESAGIVAAIAVTKGESVQAAQPLLYINAASLELQATLYVPSRMRGTLYPGQALRLSYDAFDFQHYGRYAAIVTSIDHASLDPRQHLLPVPGIREPVFKIDAQLAQSYVEGPDVYRLQPDMLFSADIVLADMSLLEYIFKPLLRLRARLA